MTGSQIRDNFDDHHNTDIDELKGNILGLREVINLDLDFNLCTLGNSEETLMPEKLS